MSMTPEEKRARRAERSRRYREANKETKAERDRRHYEANKEAVAEQRRRYKRRNGFSKEDGSSFRAWSASLYSRNKAFIAIANLQPDPGQTLAELIHELSGYAMKVCEQIANPPVAEETPELTPPAAPDLF